jgi:hypothetical protein
VQAWGESTRKRNTLYLHVLNWPSDGKLIVGGLKSTVRRAYLLADSRKAALQVRRCGELDWTIDVPITAPDATNSVVVLDCDGDIACDDHRLLLTTRPNALRVFDGRSCGPTIAFGQGKRENAYVEQWSSADDAIAWPVRVTEPASFDVALTYDADEASAGGTFQVSIAGQNLPCAVRPGREHTFSAGKVHLEPGSHTIAITPIRIAGAELMRLRTVTLTPAG